MSSSVDKNEIISVKNIIERVFGHKYFICADILKWFDDNLSNTSDNNLIANKLYTSQQSFITMFYDIFSEYLMENEDEEAGKLFTEIKEHIGTLLYRQLELNGKSNTLSINELIIELEGTKFLFTFLDGAISTTNKKYYIFYDSRFKALQQLFDENISVKIEKDENKLEICIYQDEEILIESYTFQKYPSDQLEDGSVTDEDGIEFVTIPNYPLTNKEKLLKVLGDIYWLTEKVILWDENNLADGFKNLSEIHKKEIIKYTTKYKNDPEETDFFISDEEIDSILIELDEKYKVNKEKNNKLLHQNVCPICFRNNEKNVSICDNDCGTVYCDCGNEYYILDGKYLNGHNAKSGISEGEDSEGDIDFDDDNNLELKINSNINSNINFDFYSRKRLFREEFNNNAILSNMNLSEDVKEKVFANFDIFSDSFRDKYHGQKSFPPREYLFCKLLRNEGFEYPYICQQNKFEELEDIYWSLKDIKDCNNFISYLKSYLRANLYNEPKKVVFKYLTNTYLLTTEGEFDFVIKYFTKYLPKIKTRPQYKYNLIILEMEEKKEELTFKNIVSYIINVIASKENIFIITEEL